MWKDDVGEGSGKGVGSYVYQSALVELVSYWLCRNADMGGAAYQLERTSGLENPTS